MHKNFKRALLGVAIAACFASGGAHAQSNDEIMAELKRLRQELQQVRGELDTLKHQSAPASTAAVGTPVTAAPAVAAEQAPAQPATPAPAANGAASNGLSFFGYGEMTYSRPRNDAASTQATLRRGVLGWAYRFDDKTRFAAELEIENAVVSAGDRGEAELEQFYLEHDVSSSVTAKAGLFLMPVGYTNEVHEPTRYFGVNRNLVETAIIPSTWRELGFGLRGTTESGLRWDAGLVTSFDLTKWDATSTEGQESPLGAIHQEGQFAKARDLAFYGALNYNGIPGFNLGASAFGGGVGQKQPGFAAPDASVLLTEAHVRWQPGKWDVQALAAHGQFSNVEALNATFAGQPTPVPSSFGGAYAQAAYRLWQQGDYSLVPFLRFEQLNTARGFAGLATGLAPALQPDTRVWTLGANFYLNPQVVLKLDYQRYLNDNSLDRLDLGIGFHF
jgi:hypothetical protein